MSSGGFDAFHEFCVQQDNDKEQRRKPKRRGGLVRHTKLAFRRLLRMARRVRRINS